MDSHDPQTKLIRKALRALHFFGPIHLFLSCDSHFLQVKFEQYSIIFHTLLCLSIFIRVFLAWLPLLIFQFNPLKGAKMPLCLTQRLITSSLNTSIPCALIYLILNKNYLLNMYISPWNMFM